MQIKLTIEYDGTNYSGWQLQNGQDSVQARIEAALEKIFASLVRVRASGRTDAGVHALAALSSGFAHLLYHPFKPAVLQRALNAILPSDIVILNSEAVDDSFDPRRHATARVYEYRILNQTWPSAFERRYTQRLRFASRSDLEQPHR